MRSLMTLLLLGVASCATPADAMTEPRGWCFAEMASDDRAAVVDFKITTVALDRYDQALERLAQTSAIELSPEEAAVWAGDPVQGGGWRHYLVRANVTTAPQATREEVLRTARGAGYYVYWSAARQEAWLMVHHSIDHDSEVVPNNLGLILSTPVAIRKIYLGCYVTS